MSIFVISLFALTSSICRGLISVIDRYQLGIAKENLIVVNLKNNLYTLLAASILFFSFIDYSLNDMIFNWKIMIYAVLVQLVAIGYSHIFKNLTIAESVVASKFSDLCIPIALFITTGYFSFSGYIVAIVTTLIVFKLMMVDNKRFIKQGIIIITPLLVLQSVLSPFLTEDFNQNIKTLLAFTYCTLVYRFIIVLIMLLYVRSEPIFRTTKIKKSKSYYIYFARTILTIIAQIGFTLATAGGSSLAWIFLNITSLYGVVFSFFLLKEKASKKEILALVSITFITLTKAFLDSI